MAPDEREGFAVAISSQRPEAVVSQGIGCSADEEGVVMDGWKMEESSFDEAASLPMELCHLAYGVNCCMVINASP